MKRSLRSKLLLRITIIGMISFFLSTIFTVIYFKTVLEQQIINDDRMKLRQTSRQLEYMSTNMASFTSYLIISDKLQNFFKHYNELDTYGKFSIAQEAIDYVQKNKGLNKEITSFIMVLPDGKAIWSEAQSDEYIYDHMREPWYRNYTGSGQTFAFTETHMMYATGSAVKPSPTISCIASVRDINSGAPIGELIINLDYGNFESLLAFGSETFESYLWLNQGNHALFEKRARDRNTEVLMDVANRQSLTDADESIVHVNGGFVLSERFNDNGWRLVSFTSLHNLLKRSQFSVYLLIVFTLTSTIVALLLIMPIILNITRPIYRLYHAMNMVSDGNLQTTVDIRSGDELEKLGHGFNRMVGQLRDQLEQSVRHEQEKRNMEMELLLSQINPHFIYNTLNTIIIMAQKHKNYDIARMTTAFVTLLQDTVKLGEAHRLISLQEEMNIIREYAVIQSYRYRDMFELELDVSEAALDFMIPRNIVQPLVENSIFHGIRPSQMSGIIHIRAAVYEEQLIIHVKDNGVGIPKEKLEHLLQGTPDQMNQQQGVRHIGLSNTIKRLDHIYKGAAQLEIESQPLRGTCIKLTIPQLEKPHR